MIGKMNGDAFFKDTVLSYFFCFIFSFLLTSILLYYLIPILKSKKMGQKILDIGPRWHKNKEGTPTMGGIAFLFSVTAVGVLFGCLIPMDRQMRAAVFVTLGYSFLSAIIGITDDLKKFRKRQNEGLLAHEKFLLQLVLACVYIIVITAFGIGSSVVYIPFIKETVDIGIAYYFMSVLFLVGFSNAVNLTDGIDGLCASVTAVVAVFFVLFAYRTDNAALRLLALALLGGCCGFLLYNFHPAKVFMGDTGSLFLGAAVASLAFLSFEPLILFFVGIVYLIEAVSVIMQVVYFKITKKRLFLMAPYHHHLEKKGFKETTIMGIAVTASAVFSAVAYIWG